MCLTLIDILFAKARCASKPLQIQIIEHTLLPYLLNLGILDIFQVNSFQIAKFMFYYHNQLLPPMFLNLFSTSSQVHNYGTRTASHYQSHSCRTNLKQFPILYQGPKIWNSLPTPNTNYFFV